MNGGRTGEAVVVPTWQRRRGRAGQGRASGGDNGGISSGGVESGGFGSISVPP